MSFTTTDGFPGAIKPCTIHIMCFLLSAPIRQANRFWILGTADTEVDACVFLIRWQFGKTELCHECARSSKLNRHCCMVKDEFTKVILSFHFMAFEHLEHSTIRKETNI